MKTKYIIKSNRLILYSQNKITIPISQILWIKFSDNPKDSKVKIETLSEITTTFETESKNKIKFKNLINLHRKDVILEELGIKKK